MTRTMIRALRAVGIDRAVSYGVFTRLWSLLAGPVTMFVIAEQLTGAQQGYYYTIGSLLALQLFFELGLTTVLAQFASHEFVDLRWGERGRIEGDPIARERFYDLLRKAAKWFGIAALLLVLALIPAGLVFLQGGGSAHGADFSWRLPWVLAVAGTSLNLFTIPFFAVIMGSGQVATVNHREMVGAVVSSCLCWLVLSLGGGLFSVFAVTCGNIIVSWSYLLLHKPLLLRAAWQGIFRSPPPAAAGASISWWGEVWPMQWRVALTWMAGYFIFQLFTPVLFRYQGAVTAGRMGMTLSAANALLGVSLSWISARGPELAKLAARREWPAMDALLKRVLGQAAAVSLGGAFLGWAAIHLLQEYHAIGQRFIPASHAALFFAAICVNVVMAALGAYLRAHKQEPFLPLSLTLGVVQGVATLWLGMKYSTLGVCAGFLVIHLFAALPAAFLIWRAFRRRWHEV